MDNTEKLRKVFAEALQLDISKVGDTLTYNTVPEWDSVAHMALIAAIDGEFGTMLETDDVIDMSSFGKAREILSKYGVQF